MFGLPFVPMLMLEVKSIREKNMHVKHEDAEDVWAKEGGNNKSLGKTA